MSCLPQLSAIDTVSSDAASENDLEQDDRRERSVAVWYASRDVQYPLPSKRTCREYVRKVYLKGERGGGARKFGVRKGGKQLTWPRTCANKFARMFWLEVEIAKWRANWGTPSSAPRQYGNHYNYVSSPYINIPQLRLSFHLLRSSSSIPRRFPPFVAFAARKRNFFFAGVKSAAIYYFLA